jgi:hypothetical protein
VPLGSSHGNIKNVYFYVTNLTEHWGEQMQNHTISTPKQTYNYPFASDNGGIRLLYDYIYVLRGLPESKLKNPPSSLLSDAASESIEKFTTRNSIDYVNVLIEDAFHER